MAKRNIQDVPNEELEADLSRNPTPALRSRIEEELKRRGTAAAPAPAPNQVPPPGVPQAPQGFGGNFLNSLGQFGTDTYKGLVDQGKFMGNLFLNPAAAEQQARGYLEGFSKLGDYASDRYGSMENFGNTLYNDPVGAAADLGAAGALVMTGGKALGPLASRAGAIPGMAAKAVERGGRAISNLDPITGVTTLGQAAMAPTNVARFIGSEYTKGPDVRTTPDLEAQIGGMLDEGYTPNVEGRNRWAADRDAAGADVEAAYSMADAEVVSGARQSPFTPERLEMKLNEFAPEITADRAAWNKGKDTLMKSFKSELEALGSGSMTPSEMRAFKQSLDAKISDAARTGSGTAVNPQVQNAFANAVRDLINTEFPDVGSANARFSNLQSMNKTMEKTGMSDITDFSRLELSANMAGDLAKRVATGESKVNRAMGYKALREGRYGDYLFDHSGAKSIMTIPRQQGALEERMDRSVPFRTGILDD